MLKDFSLSAIVAGFIAVVIAYASSAVIIFQAAQAGGLSTAQTASWLAMASLGCGVMTFYFSWTLKMPIITAWSTPGAALLVTALPLYSLSQAVMAYILSAVLMIICGITGLFQKAIQKIPMSIIAAMLAGILIQFCLHAFAQFNVQPLLVAVMCLVYFIAKIILPRYAIVLTLLCGVITVLWQTAIPWGNVQWHITQPVVILPQWSWSAVLGIALPLFIVAMTSQNASGLAVMHTSGYQTPENRLITATGIFSLLTAPFASHGVTLSSITAAICTSPDCHQDKQKRYIAGLSCAVFYVLFAACAGSMVQLFALVPKAFIVTIAGLALFSACSSSLKAALTETRYMDEAMLTFLLTASGVGFWGIGSAFWGLCAGILLLVVKKMIAK